MQVTSPFGNNVHHNENVTQGQFAFTTTESGNYVACFWMDGKHPEGSVSVSLDWKTGISAKDWDSVAKKEKIEVNKNMHSCCVFSFCDVLMFCLYDLFALVQGCWTWNQEARRNSGCHPRLSNLFEGKVSFSLLLLKFD